MHEHARFARGLLFLLVFPFGACESQTVDTQGFTLIDDMEGEVNRLVWAPTDARPGRWGAATACAQRDRIAPPPYVLDPTAPFYARLEAPHETRPGVTSAHAIWFRTTTPLAGVWGGSITAGFLGYDNLPPVPDAGVPPDDQPCIEDSALNYPVSTADLTAYSGVTFWARAATGSRRLLVKILDGNTDPRGGVCNAAHPEDDDGCYNGFGADVLLSDTFTRYTLDFSSLAQNPNWGYRPDPNVLDLAHVYTLNFEFDTSTCVAGETTMCAGGEKPPLSFDFWLDDLYFVNRP